MASIDIIKSLSTVLSSAVNKPQQHKEKNLRNPENVTWGCWVRSKLCYLRAIQFNSTFNSSFLVRPVTAFSKFENKLMTNKKNEFVPMAKFVATKSF